MAQVVEAPEGLDQPQHDDPHRQRRAEKPEPKPQRRFLRRWFLRGLLCTVFLAVIAAAWAKVEFDRIEQQALQLSETGTSLNTLLKGYIVSLKERDIDAVMALHAEEYHSPREGSWDLKLESSRDGVSVYSWHLNQPREFTKADVRSQLEQHLAGLEKIDFGKFKIASIEQLDQDGITTIRAVLWLRGSSPEHAKIESRTTFRMQLGRNHSGDWQIRGKEMLGGQTVVGQGVGFTDITSTSGIDFEGRHNPKLNEPEWRPDAFGIMKYSSGGVATGDYDRDGLIDVLLTDGNSTRLYRNLGAGRFEDQTVSARIPSDLKGGTSALFVDFDNDDDKDLLLCVGTGNNLLLRNDGNGEFEDVTEGSGVQGVWVATAAAADYDNDGLVDIYLGRYLDPRDNIPTTSFYTRNGERNSLLHNDGDLKFSDQTEFAGVGDTGLTLGVAWGDYDNDNFEDLYVANDFGRNALFRNNRDGTFSDVSEESGAVNIGYGMSAQFGDIDNDNDLDLIVGALHSGQRWYGNSATIQRYLLSSVTEGTIWEDWPTYRELHRYLGSDWGSLGDEVLKGNTLLLNNGDSTFADVTDETKVNPHGWYWSTLMFDVDNDCRQDVYAVNGWITGKQPDDL